MPIKIDDRLPAKERLESETIRILEIDTIPDSEFYAKYILLFIRNLIRFLGTGQCTVMPPILIQSIRNI